ncbi:MAG: RNA-binding transcriptional accessory protein [Candidimonas sp.]|nr:MAG: RNA-binding transcriptional accessory protein [Candidimonas sp.]
MTDPATSANTAATPSFDTDPTHIAALLAAELNARPAQVAAAIKLLDEGATVPFIARYRKEATGGLDDTVLRGLETRLLYVRELEARRKAILESIHEQGKLSGELTRVIKAADTKQRLEDLYAPYKPKRHTRAQKAREAGLEGLADAILAATGGDPQDTASAYLNPAAAIHDAQAALGGARDILAERFAEHATLLADLRDYLWNTGLLYATVIDGKENEGSNFRDWFNFRETLRSLPSHRTLALLRGRRQGVLDLRIGLEPERDTLSPHPCVERIAHTLGIGAGFAADSAPRARWLGEVCRWTWRVKLLPAFQAEFLARLRESAEREAIHVFAANLKDLLLAAPAGPKPIMGLDPGIRTGVKVAVVDSTGKLLDTATIYPFEPRRERDRAMTTLATMAARHGVALVAIGNGTASRQTEKLVADMRARFPESSLTRAVVSEAGASVYSASELAAREFPDLDVSLRGAVSIARRLQDPLAELVKIEPKAIGVGQYQHDVSQRELARALDTVVEDCVNAVGVDVNTASPALLARVSGLNTALAGNIVAWRDEHGAFTNRAGLRNVARFGDKAFEQAAGFLRIHGGDNPLDASAVHPEAYPVAERILNRIKLGANQVMKQPGALKGLSPADFTDTRFGLPTVRDIFAELEKPGRDPRPEFKTATFQEGIETLQDLRTGMILEGVVTNVANFGAFVDIGVHQDGLVHVSALADKYVKDPRDVVRVGQPVTVKVQDVDAARKRIALTMRLDDPSIGAHGSANRAANSADTRQRARREAVDPASVGAMAAAFARLKR